MLQFASRPGEEGFDSAFGRWCIGRRLFGHDAKPIHQNLGCPFGSEDVAAVVKDHGLRWTQCQAQLLNQFSVWVPPVTRLKRLTLGPRARAGHSNPGRGCCAPPAPKKSWGRPPSLPTIQIGRATIVERLVRPLGVIEGEIAGQPLARLAWTAII